MSKTFFGGNIKSFILHKLKKNEFCLRRMRLAMLTANRCKVCCLVRLLCLLYSIASYTWESMCQNNFRLLFF